MLRDFYHRFFVEKYEYDTFSAKATRLGQWVWYQLTVRPMNLEKQKPERSQATMKCYSTG